jgi:hypothetical protein
MEAVECLHSWLKSGIVTGLQKSMEGLMEAVSGDEQYDTVEDT